MLRAQQPIADGLKRCAMFRGQAVAVRQRLHGERRDPSLEVRVDRPAPVGTDGAEEKFACLQHDGMIGLARGGQRQRHEARERRGFEKSAGGRLDACELEQDGGRDRVAKPGNAGQPARVAAVLQEAHCDQGRQGVADDGQADEAVPG